MRGNFVRRTLLASIAAIAVLASGVLIAGAATAPKPREMKFACAKNSNGALRYVARASQCKRGEKAITISDSAPIDVCVRARRSRSLPAGSTRFVDAAARCSSARSSKETALKVPGPKKLWFCALKKTGALRNVAGRSRCSKKNDLAVFVNKAKPVQPGPQVTPQQPTPNRAPTASNDAVATGEDTTTAIAPLGNDSDPDGNVLSVASVDGTGAAGSVAVAPDGTIGYDPNGAFEDLAPGDTETDSFAYRATDGSLQSAPATVTVTVQGANDAPEPSVSSGSTAYTEGDPPVVADAGFTVADVDDANLAGATARITGGFVANEDSLVFANQNGITGTYDSGTGVLTLTGTATIAQYQAALRSVRFRTAGDGPSPNPRAVEFRVRDADDQSAPASRPLTVTGVNDAPFVNTSAGTASYTENGTGTAVDPALDVGDPDSVNFNGARVAIGTGFSSTEDELLFTPQNGITGAYDSDTGVLTLTGQATRAQYRQALRSVRYANGTDHPSGATRTVSFGVSDQADLDSGTATRNVSVEPVNDAPVNTVPTSPTIDEGGSTNFGTGPDFQIADLDSAPDDLTTMVSAPDGDVAVGPGTGTVQDNGASVQITGTVAQINSRLADVTYTPPTDADQNRSVQIVTNDGGNNGSGPNGIDTDSVTVAITAKNDPPVITKPANQTTVEDTALTFAAPGNGISVADVDAGSDPISATVAVSSGTLSIGVTTATKSTDNAASITLTGTVAQIGDALDGMVYHPAQDASGDDTLTVTADDGGNNGDATPAGQTDSESITITRTPVNDNPVLTQPDGALAYSEDTPTADLAAPIAPNLGASDVDSANGSSATVKITSGYVSGQDVLSYSGSLSSSVNGAGDTLTLSGAHSIGEYRDALRDVRYANTSEDATAGARTVEFKLTDSAAGESAGVTRTINVSATNDAPTLDTSGGSAAYSEDDTTGVQVDPSVSVADVDDTHLEGATIQVTTNRDSATDELTFSAQNGITQASWVPSTGTLTLTGHATKADYQTALQSVRFRANGNAVGGATRTVSFTVNDGGADSAADTRDLTVTPSNDAPVLTTTAGTETHTEGGAATVVDSGVSIADPDSTTTVTGARVKISDGSRQTGDSLSVTGVSAGITAAAYNPTTGELTFTGSAPIGDYETTLRNVRFTTANDDPSTSRTVQFFANDGTVDGSASRGLTITPVNDAPTVDTSAGNASYTEDDATGVEVDPAVTLADADDTHLEGATVHIGTGRDSTTDVLTFTDQNGITAAPYNAFTGDLVLSGHATKAAYQTALRSVRFQAQGDDPSALTRTVEFKVNDGDADSATDSRDVTVAPVNDAPTVTTTAGESQFTEDQISPSTTIVDGGVTVADADDTELEGATVAISPGTFQSGEDVLHFTDTADIAGTYSGGVLTLTGTASVADYQAALRSVAYSNTSQDPNTTDRAVTFKVDDGDVEGGPASKTVDVDAVNDAPALSQPDGAVTYTEDSPSENHELTVAPNVGLTDADDDTLQGATVEITNGYQSGADALLFDDQNGISGSVSGAKLTLSGSATVAQYETALRTVRYRNTSESPSGTARTVTFRADDGQALSNTVTRSINVVSVNDAPTADDETFDGVNRAVGNTDLVVDDPTDGAPAHSGPAKAVTGDILDGDADAEGTAVSVVPGTVTTHDNGSVELEADGDFVYHPPVGCTDHSDEFDYTVTDGTATSGSATVTIEVQDCVWYVDADATNGDGTSDEPFGIPDDPPFDVLTPLNGAGGAGDADGPGDTLYLAAGTYGGGLALEDDERLHTRRHGLTMPDGGTGTVTLEPAAAGAYRLDGGLTLAQDNDVQGLDLGATPVPPEPPETEPPTPPDPTGIALRGTSVGASHVNDATSGSIANPTGGAIKIDGTANDVDVGFTSVSSSGSDSEAINLVNVDGAVSLGTGTLANAGGSTVAINGGNLDFTLDAAITDDTGRLVDIRNKSGGTNAFNGAVTDGPTLADGGGVNLQSNAGLTRFDGGLRLSTGASNGISATSGGQLAVTDPAGADANTISTTGGAGIDLAFTDIHSDDLTFQRISTTNAQSGIRLLSTGSSGGLNVTGTGAANSGGSIADSTGPGISLDTVGGGVALSRMSITGSTAPAGNDGVRGTSVDGFSLTDSTVSNNGNAAGERGLDFTDLTGTVTLEQSQINGNRADNLAIVNNSGALNLTAHLTTFSGSPVGGGVRVEGNGTGSQTVNLSDDTFADNATEHVLIRTDDSNSVTQDVTLDQAQMTSTSTAAGGSNVVALPGGNAHLTARVTDNTITGARGTAVQIAASPSGSATVDAAVTGNGIGATGSARSGSFNGDGIEVRARGEDGTVNALISGNAVLEATRAGLVLEQSDGASATLNTTVTGNVITDLNNAVSPDNGIDVRIGQAPADQGTACLDIGGAGDDANSSAGEGTGAFGLAVALGGGASAQFPDLGPATSAGDVQTYLEGRNTAAPVSVTNTGTGTFQDRGTPCAQPQLGDAVNNAPVVTTEAGTTSFTEGDDPVAVDPTLTVTDAESDHITRATATITSGYANTAGDHDTLACTPQHGITCSFNAGTGRLTLTGPATGTAGEYQDVLRTVTFHNDSENSSAAQRVVSFRVTDDGDGTLTSAAADRAVDVTRVNDAPVHTVPGDQTTSMNGTLFIPGLGVSDVDAGTALLRTHIEVAHGRLTLSTTAGLTFLAGGGDGTADTQMTFRGTQSAIDAALDNLRYDPDSGYVGPDTLTLSTTDQGATGDGGPQSDNDSVQIDVQP